MADILRWFLIVLSIPAFALMVMYTVRRARELDQRIDEFHAEQEAATNQPGPINPVLALEPGLVSGIDVGQLTQTSLVSHMSDGSRKAFRRNTGSL